MKINGKAPFVIVSFINWYMNRYKISHEITFNFEDIYGISSYSSEKVIDLTGGPNLTLGTFSYDYLEKDPGLEITLYTKSYEYIKRFYPHKPNTLLHTFVHEMVHYEQFRDTGDAHHIDIDDRIEQLIKEFNGEKH